jgi:hypothetical protein
MLRVALVAWAATFTLLTMPPMGGAAPQAQIQYAEPGPIVKAALVREIQFMLPRSDQSLSP